MERGMRQLSLNKGKFGEAQYGWSRYIFDPLYTAISLFMARL
jgi:hypothetical protein